MRETTTEFGTVDGAGLYGKDTDTPGFTLNGKVYASSRVLSRFAGSVLGKPAVVEVSDGWAVALRPVTVTEGEGVADVPAGVVRLRAAADAVAALLAAARTDVASLDVLARGDRAMVDAAQGVIADLRAKISECAAMGLELGRRLTERDAQLADKTVEARDAEDKVSDLTAQLADRDAALTTGRAEVERLRSAAIDAVKGTTVTAINAIGGAAQKTIDGLRAEVERLAARELEARVIISAAGLFTDELHGRRVAWLAGRKS